MKQRIEDRETTAWLKANGLKDEFFVQLPLKHINALRAAHRLLTQHPTQLNTEQRKELKTYTERIYNRRLRSTITEAHANEVFSISAKVNRQLFRQRRKQRQH
jgi:hypothetical protein